MGRCPWERRSRAGDCSREGASEGLGRKQNTGEIGFINEGARQKKEKRRIIKKVRDPGPRSFWVPLCQEGLGAEHKVQFSPLIWGEGSLEPDRRALGGE